MLIRDTKAKKIETKKLFPSMASNFHKINLLLDFEMFLINSERNKNKILKSDFHELHRKN
jgi:hypothetical protein